MIAAYTIPPVDQSLRSALEEAWQQKTKPPGSLGRLEQLAIQIALIQKTLTPQLSHPTLMIFAGDHGIAASPGVSPYPQAVTAAMLENFAAGGAAINVLARQFSWELMLINSGVAQTLELPQVLNESIALGTQSWLNGPAMSHAQYEKALARGAALLRERHRKGARLLACGEMGIGNSSAAALLLHYLLKVPLDTVLSRGAGCDDQQLEQKREILKRVCQLHGELTDPEEILRCFAGFEMVMMLGAILEAARLGMPIVIDGLIVSSACLPALQLHPQLKEYLIFAHCSAALGHRHLLSHLGVKPLYELDMRLGEGTGAALALPLLQAACALLNDMASFTTAGVPNAHGSHP